MNEAQTNHYAVLGVEPAADFAALRKAYRRAAMECHPDRFGGDRTREARFKRLVEAFDVLTDPRRRREYDAARGVAPPAAGGGFPVEKFEDDEDAILDTFADDILEELIVGNTVPRGTTLQTLMLDLERTERFCMFREAKNHFYAGRIAAAAQVFNRYLREAPGNILARYYLARCCVMGRNWARAERELEKAVELGARRTPPLRLRRIRRELHRVRRKRPGLLARLRRLFLPDVQVHDLTTAEERERRALNRTINRLAAERPPWRPRAVRALPERREG